VNPILFEALRLKELNRAGWTRVGIEQPESVASHSWNMCWLVMVLAPSNINRARALELAVIHDLAEIDVGDITPHDGISKAEKQKLETAAIGRILKERPDLLALWKEYDDGETPESKFVHDIDRLDMALQATHYAHSQGADTSEFLDSARKSIHHEEIATLIDSLTKP